MISPQNPVSATDIEGRGFIAEKTTTIEPLTGLGGQIVSTPPVGQARLAFFWRSVIAGALVVYSIALMSEALMFGCHVGTLRDGALSFGAGTAFWIVVTAAVAYFFGGWAAGCFSAQTRPSFLRGLGVWALSVPLFLVIGAFVSAAAGLAMGPQNSAHMTEFIVNNGQIAQIHSGNLFASYGAAWTVFISLLTGLVFAMIGSTMTPAATDEIELSID